jgi:hypothetical protein
LVSFWKPQETQNDPSGCKHQQRDWQRKEHKVEKVELIGILFVKVAFQNDVSDTANQAG